MRYRALALFPLAWGAAFLVGYVLSSGTPALPVFIRTQMEMAKALGLLGSWAAALAFARGDYLRRAWFLVGGLYAFLLVRDFTVLVPGPFHALGPGGLDVLRQVLVVLGNLSSVIGIWMVARTWKVAALSLPGSAHGQWLVVAGVVALAVIVAGPGVVISLRRLAGGDIPSVAGLASALGDMLGLCFIGPLLLTALALRGGVLGWPWALLTLAQVVWLLYDATAVIGQDLALSAAATRATSELFRAMACTLGFSAGMAQRTVLRRLRRFGSAAKSSSP